MVYILLVVMNNEEEIYQSFEYLKENYGFVSVGERIMV